tara:strand:- start:1906 stop:2805 length:900 start_codon:yes stop_codon:yes gene_type:complete
MSCSSELVIDCNEFSAMSGKLHRFFRSRCFTETYAQNHLDTLSACENPYNVATHQYLGETWPLRQTNQMALEEYLMSMTPEQIEKTNGLYCFTTSYRQERKEDIVKGRHFAIFPMIEFEIPRADVNELISFEKDLIRSLGYEGEMKEINYEDACAMYDVDELTHVEEDHMCKNIAPVIFLKYFPERSQPYWNMKRDPSNPLYAFKVDVLLLGTEGGMETIGSAEREVNIEFMRHGFNTVSDGMYAKTMYEKFGKERVDNELDRYLNLPMMKRSGAGIGGTRLLNFMRHFNLLNEENFMH